MALEPRTWVGLAIFIFACGFSDLVRGLLSWYPPIWQETVVDTLVASLSIAGAFQMRRKVKEVRKMNDEEIKLRFSIYHDTPAANLKRLRELAFPRKLGDTRI